MANPLEIDQNAGVRYDEVSPTDRLLRELDSRLRELMGPSYVELGGDRSRQALVNYSWAAEYDTGKEGWSDIERYVERNLPRMEQFGPQAISEDMGFGDDLQRQYVDALEARDAAAAQPTATPTTTSSSASPGGSEKFLIDQARSVDPTTSSPTPSSTPPSSPSPYTPPPATPVTTDGDGPSDRLPGGYDVWKVGDDLYLVYTLSGSDVPMGWRVDGDPASIIGGDWESQIDQTLTEEQAAERGMMPMGRHSDLKNSEADPFDNFLDVIEERIPTEPWLADPEMLTQAAEAYLEGRGVTLSDMRETEWFNSRTAKERDWIAYSAQASPADVQQRREDRRAEVRQMLLSAGVSDPPPQLVNYLTEQDLTGAMSNVEFAQQITAIADPYSGVELDPGVQQALQGIDLVTAAQDTRAMRTRVQQWLGPFAGSYTDRQLQEWSGMLRNDPNGEAKLEDILRGQRMALLPEYANPDIRWADAAAPWKAVAQQQWGEQIADDDPLLLDIVKANDMNAASEMLRREGVRRGIGGSVNQLTGAMSQAFGSNVVRSL